MRSAALVMLICLGGAALSFAQVSAPSSVTINVAHSSTQGNVVSVGENVTFTATAFGTAPYTYQWSYAGTPITGATGASYAVNNVTTASGGNYSVTLTNSAGSATGLVTLFIKGPAPSITQQPTAQSLTAGDTLTLTATVSGTPPYSYGWYRNNVALTFGTTSANTITYTKSGITPSDAGTYKLGVSIANPPSESAYSDAVAVTVAVIPPTITQQPTAQTSPVNGSVTFSVTATGSLLSYTWLKDGVNVKAISSDLGQGASSTNPNFFIGVVHPEYAGNYSVVISNSAGSVTSNAVKLTTTPGIIVNTQPQSQTVTQGGSATFSVAAVSAPGTPNAGTATGITYQWLKNGIGISGANASTLTLSNLQPADAANYSAAVYWGWERVTSNAATLTVNPGIAPTITTQPSDQTVASGSPATFSVAATGTTPFSYQWRRDGNPIAGATSATFTIASTFAASAADYSVVVTNPVGSVTSRSAKLIVLAPAGTLGFGEQPVNQTVSLGAPATFSVFALGQLPFSYQWYKDGNPLAGAIAASYSIASVQTSDVGSYSVLVTSSWGSMFSNAATLAIGAPPAVAPAITAPPPNISTPAGTSATFTVTATGTAPLSYQWRKNGTAIPGASSTSLSITNAQAADAGDYSVVVTNSAGSVSATATLTVVALVTSPTISIQPVSQSTTAGASVSFSVTATGTAPLSYQWRKDGVAIAGATAATFSVTNVQSTDIGSFTVVVSNASGSVTSSAATLSITAIVTAPNITTQPAGQSANPGAAAVFSVVATGTAPLSYQWSKDGTAIAGATASTFSIASAKNSDAGAYTVVVSNSAGAVTSNPARLDLKQPPTITSQPTSQSVAAGGSVTFTVGAVGYDIGPGGAAANTYQWRKDGVAIAGATNASFSLNNVQSSDAGSYTVLLTNSAGSVASSAALLTVTATVPAAAPTITTQPTSQTVASGATATFSVTAGPTFPLSYAWFRNGVLQPGTLPTLTLTNVSAVDAGEYYVRVANIGGTYVDSQKVTLTVLAPTNAPTIITQPVAQTAPAGGNVTFVVSAGGTPAPTFQWYKRGVGAVSGATSGSFTITSVGVGDAGDYYAVATNSAGSVTSADAHLTVSTTVTTVAPTIAQQPAAQNVSVGGSVTFSVVANGTPTPTYQWFFNGAAIGAATSASFSRTSAAATDAGSYFVRVTNSAGTVDSSAVLLSVLTPEEKLSITAQPASKTVSTGSSVTFTVSVQGPAALNYQWFKDGQPLSGATQASLTLANVQSAQAGKYSVSVSTRLTAAPQTVTSSDATLVVTSNSTPATAPSITTQPHARTVDVGASVSFFFGVTGNPTPTLQWRKNSVAISGATADTLIIPRVSVADTADYDCVATNSAGSITSSAARLTVNTSLTITASSLTGTLVAGGSAVFSVTATGTSPITYQWFRGDTVVPSATGATLNLSNLVTGDAGDYKVVVSGPGGTRSATFKLVLGTTVVAPAISQQPTSATVDLGTKVTFTAAAIGTPAPTWQWRLNGSPIAGATSATYTISAAQLLQAGTYTAVATNSAGSAVTNGAVLEIKISATSAAAAGIYFGKLGTNGADGNFAIQLRRDGTGVMLINLPGSKSAILVSDFRLNDDGTFSVSGTVLAAAKAASATDSVRSADSQSITGSISSTGTVSGTVGGLPLSGTRSTGDSAAAGFYSASATGGASGTVYAIVAPDGAAIVVAQTATGVESGTATAKVSGASASVTVTTTSGVTLATTLNADSGAVTTTADKGSLAGTTFAGLRDDVERTDRLANISTRGRAGSGAEVMIAGFVVSGTDPRPVLIRAVGPALVDYGLPGALADSRLELYRDSTKISESDNWGSESSATAIVAAGTRVGAFALPAAGKDAVLLATLDPGSYTAQVSGPNGTGGVALVEVYDAGEGATSSTAPRLTNISTRASVGIGDDVLIAGIVVTGNTPKRVLVRAVGPTLANFGLDGALADPVLKILSEQTTISSNDDWGTQSGSVAAADIASASASVGAFALPSGSKDACLLITLQPGNYTAQISGKNNSTGIALVEVYELP